MFQFYSYFHTVPIGVLLLVYSIYSLQLLSFCIFNAQLFDRVVRAMLGTLFIYGVSLLIYPSIVVWPVGLQYLLMFISPFIGGYSLFQVSGPSMDQRGSVDVFSN